MSKHRAIIAGCLATSLLFCGSCEQAPSLSKTGSPFKAAWAPDQQAQVPGLKSGVDIVLDKFGVPHVYASNDQDLAMAMGYLHAKERLFWMDTLRHVATGRLTEYLGKSALPVDLTLRKLMMTNTGASVADAIYQGMSPELAQRLQAYSQGVNLHLNELRAGQGSLPPGYQVPALATLTPADIPDWNPSDTIAVGRLQELGLTSGTAQEDLERGIWAQSLSPERFADLARFAPADPTVVIPDWFSKVRALLGADQAPAWHQGKLRERDLRTALDSVKFPGQTLFDRHLRGSNNWVIGGQYTQSGHPIVANDPHLDFTTPATFYHAHLNTTLLAKDNPEQGIDVIGVTTPGSPDVTIGHNQSIAWGGTVVGWDVADVYLETLSPDASAVRFNGQFVPILKFPQTFVLGGAKDTGSISEVIEYVPHHGPIMSKDPATQSAVTVKWTGRIPSQELSAIHDMGRASNMQQFVQAVSGLTVLAQSWNGADTKGQLAYFPYAQIPVRASVTGACRPYLPMDGTGPCEWVGMLPADKVPSKQQGQEGWLVTANNDVAGSLLDNDPANETTYLLSDRSMGFRAGRITQVIRGWIDAQKKISVQDMIDLQGDVKSLLAQRMVPHLLAAAQSKPDLVASLGLQDAIARLSAWDFDMSAGTAVDAAPRSIEQSIAASIYSVYLVELAKLALGDEYAQAKVEIPGTMQIKTLLLMLEAPDLLKSPESYWDRVDTAGTKESKEEIMLQSLGNSLKTLATPELFASTDPQTWRWGKLHKMKILDPLAAFTGQAMRELGPFERQGGNFTVDVGSQRGVSTDFSFRAGPQMRFVAHLLPDGPVAVNALPGGQSDDPQSPHYDDLLQKWLRNETFPYFFKLSQVLDNKEYYIRWEP